MKRNVMFAVFLWMIAFKNPLAADRALSAISRGLGNHVVLLILSLQES